MTLQRLTSIIWKSYFLLSSKLRILKSDLRTSFL